MNTLKKVFTENRFQLLSIIVMKSEERTAGLLTTPLYVWSKLILNLIGPSGWQLLNDQNFCDSSEKWKPQK